MKKAQRRLTKISFLKLKICCLIQWLMHVPCPGNLRSISLPKKTMLTRLSTTTRKHTPLNLSLLPIHGYRHPPAKDLVPVCVLTKPRFITPSSSAKINQYLTLPKATSSRNPTRQPLFLYQQRRLSLPSFHRSSADSSIHPRRLSRLLMPTFQDRMEWWRIVIKRMPQETKGQCDHLIMHYMW